MAVAARTLASLATLSLMMSVVTLGCGCGALRNVVDRSAGAGQTAMLDEVAARRTGPDRRAIGTIVRGRAATAIVAEAERFGAHLILVGSRGHGALETLVLGSVSAEVVDQAHCPVLVVRTDTLDRLILADDGGPEADRAADLVAGWPMLRSASVAVIDVAPYPMVFGSGVAPTQRVQAHSAYADALADARAEAQAIVDRRVAVLCDAGIDAHAVVREGDPATRVVELAREWTADLVVVGTRGLAGLARVVLGSTARNILLDAPCSVLIAKRPPGE